MKAKIFTIFSVLGVAIFSFCEGEKCLPRSYSHGSIVCVCNATYCDSIPKTSPPSIGQYIMFTSTKKGLRFEKKLGNFEKRLNIRALRASYRINKKKIYQKIFGFGGAFTDSSCINILSLPKSAQNFLLGSYFSSDGIEYTMGRVPIGGTDFSTRGYTYQDAYTGGNLRAFKLAREDLDMKIPLIKRAQSMTRKQIKLVATCWSPPIWMKTNMRLTGFGSLLSEHYQTYANYHVKFLNEYKKHDIEYWCITTGNEPSIIAPKTKANNALVWTPDQQRRWIRNNLGPSIRSTHPETCIIAVDDQRFTYPWWLSTIVKDKEAAKYVNGTGVHWYFDDEIPPTVLERTHEKHPDIFILYTESAEDITAPMNEMVSLGNWTRAEHYAHDIIESMNNWVTGWIDWNLALSVKGGPSWIGTVLDAAILVNKTANEFYKEPMFYAIGHFSKFIPPGSVRLGGSFISPNVIQTLAVKTAENNIAVVFLNKKSYDVEFTFIDDDRGLVQLQLPQHSISTMIYQ